MLLKLDHFTGIAPKTAPTKLPAGAAQTANECRFWSGELRPWLDTTTVSSPVLVLGDGSVTNTAGSTIYRAGQAEADTQYWINYNGKDVDICRVPGTATTDEMTVRMFPDASSEPMVSVYPYSVAYKLSGPKPSTSVTCGSVTGTATPNTSKETRYYTMTYLYTVGSMVIESQPAAVDLTNSTCSIYPGQSVALTLPYDSSYGTGRNPTGKNLYRTNTSASGTDYQLVNTGGAIAWGTTSYTDSVETGALAQSLPSEIWDAPDTTFFGVVGMANGIMAAITGNQVAVTPASRPYAYPLEYRYPIDFKPVGLGAFGNYLCVCTTGDPYVGYGTSPDGFIFERIKVAQACVSKRSIVSTGDGVIYASPDGLVAVSNGAAPVLTAQYYSRDEWALLNPSSIFGIFCNGRYHGFYDATSIGGTTGGFIFDIANGSFVKTSVFATAGWVDPVRTVAYLKVGTSIVRWNASGSARTYTWRSGKFELPKPVNFEAAQVQASSYSSLTFKLYGDGNLRHTQTVTSRDPFMLPSGFKDYVIELEVTGTDAISMMAVAESVAELKGV